MKRILERGRTVAPLCINRIRSGATVVDMIVAMAMIAILTTLIASAVVQSREAARRVTCQSRLHQIGLASTTFEERTGFYPSGPGEYGELAWFGRLLADLNQRDLQRELDLRANDIRALQLYWQSHSLPLFQCPSDPGSLTRQNTSYSINTGSGFSAFNDEETPELQFPHGMSSRVAGKSVLDGVSNTAFVAEQLSVFPSTHDRRARWKTPIAFLDSSELDQFADLCSSMPVQAIGVGRWDSRDITSICVYDHIMTPNQPSCQNGNENLTYSTYAASSEHAGGVNVLFVDGSVRFISNSVARRVWRALGTRDGSEVVSMQ